MTQQREQSVILIDDKDLFSKINLNLSQVFSFKTDALTE